jgi:hypothetical protein
MQNESRTVFLKVVTLLQKTHWLADLVEHDYKSCSFYNQSINQLINQSINQSSEPDKNRKAIHVHYSDISLGRDAKKLL